VFLDEVGELNLSAQAKLLRVVESKEIQRLGDPKALPVDLRIVAATNRDLEQMVQEGTFRSDLFYRLNVARIHIPPLRERMEDFPELVAHCIKQLNTEFGCIIEGVDADVIATLAAHAWPGNVRELRNVLEAAYINCFGPLIGKAHLPESFLRSSEASPSERQRILSVLASVQWNKTKAARQLRWSRMTLYRKLAKYGLCDLDKPSSESPTS
jgi:two-component system response regulator HydG/two-component system response regulator AtoC